MLSLCILLFSSLAFSGAMGESVVPTHFSAFVGIGGGYNSVQFKQSLYGIGVANYTGGFTGSGTAQGPAGTFMIRSTHFHLKY